MLSCLFVENAVRTLGKKIEISVLIVIQSSDDKSVSIEDNQSEDNAEQRAANNISRVVNSAINT